MIKKTFIAIILARGGSKGIKNKNLKIINKKPLIYWSFLSCLKSKMISETWISSDSNKILNYAKKNKINLIKRPKKFAKDNSSSESAWLHAIKFIENKGKKIDYVVGIQPTSPIRAKNDLDKAVNLFIIKKFDSLFSSSVINDFNIWEKNSKTLEANYNFKKRKPRQQINENFLENGSFYIFNSNGFKKEKCRLFGKIGTYIQSKIYSFQLDDMDDFFILSSIFKGLKK